MSREKQIYEILKIVCTRYANGICSVDGKPCEEISNCEHRRIANRLYNADCRKQEWISVNERLPEPQKLVLCIWERGDDRRNYGFARYQRENVWYVSNLLWLRMISGLNSP